MGKLHTHYDNLKVSRDAPIGVIKAAYKALAQANHPDRCTLPDAPRRMQIINDAYAALSDPTRRAAHDQWINKNETHSTSQSNVKVHSTGEKLEQLRALHRRDLYQERQQYEAKIAVLNGRVKRYRHFGLIFGLLVSIPIHFGLYSISHALAMVR